MTRKISWVSEKTESVKTYRCPCCGYKTLYGRGGFEICEVCYWEDDGQDEVDKDIALGGPNGDLSLSQARANFQKFGASDRKFKTHVRPPEPDEL
jgi:hypothetical protein